MSEQLELLKVREVCPKCGQERAHKGSMTQWLFKETRCNCESDEPSPGQNSLPSTQFPSCDDLRILETLGSGGMGTVYKVLVRRLSKEFAVKVLKPEFVKDKYTLKRFQHEAKLVLQLTHPNLAAYYAQGVMDDGSPFLLMDLVDGESLSSVLAFGHRFDEPKTLHILAQIAEAVDYAHSKGVVHRDIKPGNVLICDGAAEKVKLIDFGIAKIMPRAAVDISQTITQSGDVLGSPAYMSPEQCLGESVDQRTDIYSMGCLGYELLAGHPPFEAGSAVRTIIKQISEEPAQLKTATVIGESMAKVIAVALQKQPHKRYQSAADMLEDLRAIQSQKPPQIANLLLGQIKDQKNIVHNLPGSGMPRSEAGQVVSGLATLCCLLGCVNQVAFVFGAFMSFAASIYWYRFLFVVTKRARQRSKSELVVKKLSPWGAVGLSIMGTHAGFILGTGMVISAVSIACLFHLVIKPAIAHASSTGNIALKAVPILLTGLAALIVPTALIAYLFWIVSATRSLFAAIAQSQYADAPFDQQVERRCLQIAFIFTLPALGLLAIFVKAGTAGVIIQLLIAITCFIAFILTGKLLRILDSKVERKELMLEPSRADLARSTNN
ncbi:MAG: protein kinase [Candidatus Obscuribacterales bacterium]|nr:protein kinase [Candidatus Obscuribacterales bacterium]